jgi:hypothetical protein
MGMGTDIHAYLLIDDNTPQGQPPFTNDPSYWDLRNDIGLSWSHDYCFYAAIAGVRTDSRVEPLFPPRGLPNFPTPAVYREIIEELDDRFAVGWLTLDEIRAALAHMKIDTAKISECVQVVLDVMAVIEGRYGRDRVRLLFGFG